MRDDPTQALHAAMVEVAEIGDFTTLLNRIEPAGDEDIVLLRDAIDLAEWLWLRMG